MMLTLAGSEKKVLESLSATRLLPHVEKALADCAHKLENADTLERVALIRDDTKKIIVGLYKKQKKHRSDLLLLGFFTESLMRRRSLQIISKNN